MTPRHNHKPKFPQNEPIEECRVPPGSIALSMDIKGINPLTFVMQFDEVIDAMQTFEAAMSCGDYASNICAMMHATRAAKLAGNTAMLETIGLSAFWSAMCHPTGGDTMREAVIEAMRTRQRAHITWAFQERLTITVSDRYIDLGALETSQKDLPPMVTLVEHAVRDTVH